MAYDPYANPYITQSPAGTNARPQANSNPGATGVRQTNTNANSLAPSTQTQQTQQNTTSGTSTPSTGAGSTGSGGAGSSGGSGSGGSTATPGTVGSGSSSISYDPSNPIRALRNALSQSGVNPLGSNPLVRYLMTMAQGLSTSFLTKGAQGGFGADTADNVSSQGDMPEMYRKFLMGGLSNGAGLRSLLSPGQQSSQMIGAANTLHGALSQNDNASQLSPFLNALNEAMGQAGNSSQMISSMYTPFLGSYGRAFSNNLSGQEDMGYDWLSGNERGGTGQARDPNTHDIFSYLLGMR